MKQHSVLFALVVSGVASMALPACAIEMIDDLIDERGVTYCSETIHGVDTSTGTSTSSDPGETTLVETTLGGSSTTSDSSTGEVTDESSSASTGLGPFCGDGIVEGDETCDDMNDIPDDGCNACARDSIVFITSVRYQGNVNGLDGADQRCRMLAAIAELPRFETYRAWLSSSTMSAGERLQHSRGRYVLVNGLVVAQDWDALVSGSIEHPINVDEYSQTQTIRAWTSTLASGEAVPGANFCADWTDVGNFEGGTGISGMTDETWSYYGDGPCGLELHLYCVEQ